MRLYGAKREDWRGMLSEILQQDYGLSPLPEIARTAEGKPHFPALPGLHFSVSHSRGLVLLALGATPVGVDVEHIRPRKASLPREALTAAEYAQYGALGGDWPAFYVLWTRKEAWCKYTGRGLARSWGQTPETEGLHYKTYEGPGWKAALCSREEPPGEILWWDPLRSGES